MELFARRCLLANSSFGSDRWACESPSSGIYGGFAFVQNLKTRAKHLSRSLSPGEQLREPEEFVLFCFVESRCETFVPFSSKLFSLSSVLFARSSGATLLGRIDRFTKRSTSGKPNRSMGGKHALSQTLEMPFVRLERLAVFQFKFRLQSSEPNNGRAGPARKFVIGPFAPITATCWQAGELHLARWLLIALYDTVSKSIVSGKWPSDL